MKTFAKEWAKNFALILSVITVLVTIVAAGLFTISLIASTFGNNAGIVALVLVFASALAAIFTATEHI